LNAIFDALLNNRENTMGHVILIFGTLVAVNLGIGYMVSDYIYEEEPVQGVVEVEEVAPVEPPAVSVPPSAPQSTEAGQE
jgi:hypothetical protein